MSPFHERTKILIKQHGLQKLQDSHILIAGLGGVGGYVVEALARAGVGNLTIIDNDNVDPTNINRQLIALNSSIGLPKVELFEKRILDINPNCNLTPLKVFLNNDNIEEIVLSQKFDYVIDCIDSLNCKVGLVETAWKNNIKVISSMGAGGKIDPTLIKVTDIFKTSICPLALFMRLRLRRRDVGNGVKAVYSTEVPVPPQPAQENISQQHATDTNDTLDTLAESRRHRISATVGSISYIPAIMGLTIAGEAIKEILSEV